MLQKNVATKNNTQKNSSSAVNHKLWIGGRWQKGVDAKSVISPFTQEQVATAEQASAEQMKEAALCAAKAFSVYKKSSRHQRASLLGGIAGAITKRKADFITSMIQEAGKPSDLAEIEVTRAATTFLLAFEETKRLGGEMIPLDGDVTSTAFSQARIFWVPRGPVLGITPFNFPLNLVAHKVAPALAAGVSIVIKSSPQTPGCARILAEIFEKVAGECGVPLDVLQVVACSNEVAQIAVKDQAFSTFSFTGSHKVGVLLQREAAGKRVCLELGGNAAVIVHEDADLIRAASRIATGAFSYAGQSCISIQRIFVYHAVATKFEELLKVETQKLVVGDPIKTGVVVGPVIDKAAADRILSWIDEAKKLGAKVVFGGKRSGNVIEPVLLFDVPPKAKIVAEEVFGPVAVLAHYKDEDQVLKSVNESRFGIHAGVFTNKHSFIQKAIEELEVGGVMINEIPTFRSEALPYGGVKDSGIGREGVRSAMEEMSERKTVIEHR